jgi:translation initiation factor 1 (eIF-1/SUI1)
MNPFEDDVEETNTVTINEYNIEIWLETYGRKKNTFVSGWTLTEEEFKNIKKKNGCNGSMKKDNDTGKILIQFQGDLVDYMNKYITEQGVDSQYIRIKG